MAFFVNPEFLAISRDWKERVGWVGNDDDDDDGRHGDEDGDFDDG